MGTRGRRPTRWQQAGLVATIATLTLAPAPATAAEELYSLRCSGYEAGTTIDCDGYMTEPEGPVHVTVTLLASDSASETVLFDDTDVDWDDHEFWFSFAIPDTALQGDELRFDISTPVDGNDRSLVRTVVGGSGAPSRAPTATPSAEPTPSEPQERDAPTRADVTSEPPEVPGTSTETVEVPADELPRTGLPLALVGLLALGILAAGMALLTRGARATR